jgi:hypothetical protein
MTKAELLARHGVVNGSSLHPQQVQPVVHDAEHGLHGVAHVAEPVDEANGHATSQATADPLAPPHIVLREAEHQLDLARAEARRCRAATTEARANFARCLGAWNATQPIQTQEQLMKQHIASNQAERAKRYAAGQGVFYPGVGRTAKALAGGNAKNGGGAAYRRGAYTRAQAMEIEAGKLRAAAATRMNGSNASRAKLPSER